MTSDTQVARNIRLTHTTGDRQWFRSVWRLLAGQTVLRSMVRTHGPSVSFCRQRQSVAFPSHAGHVMDENNFYSTTSDPCATSCVSGNGLRICDTCKSTINWYFGHLSRHVSELMLQSQPIGSFLVRNSSSRCGTFALSVRVKQDDVRPSGVAHYLLIKSSKSRVQIKGFRSDFDCVQSLLLHYSRTQELLPCRLRLDSQSADQHQSYHNELRLTAMDILTRS